MLAESNAAAVQWVINIVFNTLQNKNAILGLKP